MTTTDTMYITGTTMVMTVTLDIMVMVITRIITIITTGWMDLTLTPQVSDIMVLLS